jgi:DDE superfamily endonuclease
MNSCRRRRLASPNATIASTNATEQPICSSSSTCIDPGGRSRLPTAGQPVDFATCMRELTDVDFPNAERIRVVMDNLSTHSPGALYQAFPACEARRVLRRVEFHYVPKHTSWLNMVEIEIGVLRGQCLDPRIGAPRHRRRGLYRPKRPLVGATDLARLLAGFACSRGDLLDLRPTPKWPRRRCLSQPSCRCSHAATVCAATVCINEIS